MANIEDIRNCGGTGIYFPHTIRLIKQIDLWIGLVHVKPLDRQAFGYAGAFTNIVAWAYDVPSFRQKAEVIAETLEMSVAEVDEVEPLAERAEKSTLTGGQDARETCVRAGLH